MSILERIRECVEVGKADASTPFPPELAGSPGASELTRQALDGGVSAGDVLRNALVPGMEAIGQRFARNEAFVPDLLMSARAMKLAMEHLAPHFRAGEVQRKGTLIIGTVQGDLHDIGKNLVAMMVEGGGYEVVDLGIDVSARAFIDGLAAHPGAAVGLSALLSTTMASMEATVRAVKDAVPGTTVLVGGAPITDSFRQHIGADFFGREPQSAVRYLDSVMS